MILHIHFLLFTYNKWTFLIMIVFSFWKLIVLKATDVGHIYECSTNHTLSQKTLRFAGVIEVYTEFYLVLFLNFSFTSFGSKKKNKLHIDLLTLDTCGETEL